MAKNWYKFKKPEPKKKRIRFDVMIGDRFIRTFVMEYNNEIPKEYEMRDFVEKKMPATLKGKEYKICF